MEIVECADHGQRNLNERVFVRGREVRTVCVPSLEMERLVQLAERVAS
jgi:hypothetical protein